MAYATALTRFAQQVTPAGASSQLGCVKHVFTDGFTVGVTEYVMTELPSTSRRTSADWRHLSEKTKKATLCSIAGISGPCGPAGVNVKVDLTGGTGTAPPPSGPAGTKDLTAAQLSNKPIKRDEVVAKEFIA